MFRHIKKANLWSIMWLGLLHDRVERDNSENCWNTWKAKKTFSYRKSRLRKENRMERKLFYEKEVWRGIWLHAVLKSDLYPAND
jgi:Fe-S cluster biosynthesis and repair protein YggX